MNRQTVLADSSRTFSFLMTEQAVRWQRAAPEVMAAQCRHMASVAEHDHVELGILPNHVDVPEIPLNTFVLYDDNLVVVELFSGEIVLRDPRDIAFHLSLFGCFLDRALTGTEAVGFLHTVAADFTSRRTTRG